MCALLLMTVFCIFKHVVTKVVLKLVGPELFFFLFFLTYCVSKFVILCFGFGIKPVKPAPPYFSVSHGQG